MEKDTTFSDSDMSQEELCYLPVTPIPDPPEPQVPESQDKLLEGSSNPVDNNNSGSLLPETAEQAPLSETADPNVDFMNNALTLYTDDAEGTRGKRMRKPSQKMLELQEQKAKKASKSKKKPSTEENNGNENGFYCDEVSAK